MPQASKKKQTHEKGKLMPRETLETAPNSFVPLDFDAADLLPGEPDHPTFVHPHTGRHIPVNLEALALGEALHLFRDEPSADTSLTATHPLPVAEVPASEQQSAVRRGANRIRSIHSAKDWKILGASALLAITGSGLAAAWHHRAPQREPYYQQDTPLTPSHHEK